MTESRCWRLGGKCEVGVCSDSILVLVLVVVLVLERRFSPGAFPQYKRIPEHVQGIRIQRQERRAGEEVSSRTRTTTSTRTIKLP